MADGGWLLGIEIGGTKLQLGLGLGDGRIAALRRLAVVPEDGAEGVRDQVARAFPTLLADAGIGPDAVRAAGVGFGGPVDPAHGIVTLSNQVRGWERFPLVDWVRDALGVGRVALQNDADTAGLGEAKFGAGVGRSPVLYVTVGSGVGGGLIIDGRIYRGGGLGAVEIGHLWIHDPDDEADADTLERVASGWGMARVAREHLGRLSRAERSDNLMVRLAGGDPAKIDAPIIAEAARRGDRLAAHVLDLATRSMAIALGHAVTLLAPRRIVLGGGVSLMPEPLWLGPIRRQLERRAFPPFRGSFDVVPAALGEEVVVQGALALARDALDRQEAG